MNAISLHLPAKRGRIIIGVLAVLLAGVLLAGAFQALASYQSSPAASPVATHMASHASDEHADGHAEDLGSNLPHFTSHDSGGPHVHGGAGCTGAGCAATLVSITVQVFPAVRVHPTSNLDIRSRQHHSGPPLRPPRTFA